MESKAIVGDTSRAEDGTRKAQATSAKLGARKGAKAVEAHFHDHEVRRMIETDAYFRAERRGFAAGAELADWLDAEAEVSRVLDAGGWRAG